jgi:hypothetical protein
MEDDVGISLRYRPEAASYIVVALQVMLENLRSDLLLNEVVSSELDTDEEHEEVFKDSELPMTAEDIRQMVEKSKDKTMAELGHAQKRIDEVEALKSAFESSTTPSVAILNQTYAALRSSLTLEAMRLCFHNPREHIFATGVVGLGVEKAEEVQRIGKTLQIYTEALMFGFNLNTLSWNEFPFDD